MVAGAQPGVRPLNDTRSAANGSCASIGRLFVHRLAGRCDHKSVEALPFPSPGHLPASIAERPGDVNEISLISDLLVRTAQNSGPSGSTNPIKRNCPHSRPGEQRGAARLGTRSVVALAMASHGWGRGSCTRTHNRRYTGVRHYYSIPRIGPL